MTLLLWIIAVCWSELRTRECPPIWSFLETSASQRRYGAFLRLGGQQSLSSHSPLDSTHRFPTTAFVSINVVPGSAGTKGKSCGQRGCGNTGADSMPVERRSKAGPRRHTPRPFDLTSLRLPRIPPSAKRLASAGRIMSKSQFPLHSWFTNCADPDCGRGELWPVGAPFPRTVIHHRGLLA